MVRTIAVHMPNLLPDWHFFRPAGRLIWSSLIIVVGVGVILWMCKKPKPAEPATWAQAMLGAVVVWALMIVAYGTVPHEWLTFANKYLRWDESHFLVQNNQEIGPIHWLHFTINKRALTDVVATLIYVVMLGLNIWLVAKWQKRPERSADDTATETVVGTSAYGRPLTAKG